MATSRKSPKVPVAFPFVLDELESAQLPGTLTVRPMFGCHAIYVGERIYLMLRHKEDAATRADNGIWLVVADEHVAEIRRRFPALRPIQMFADFKKSTPTWYNLPEAHPDFEAVALEFVAMVRRGDVRIGKVPQSTRKKRKKTPRARAVKKAKAHA